VAGTGHGYYYGHGYYGHGYYPYYGYGYYPYYYGGYYPGFSIGLGWYSDDHDHYDAPPVYGYPPYVGQSDPDRGTYAPPNEREDMPPDAQGNERVDDRDAAELRLRVWPSDATVYVDGQFHGTARDNASLRLAPGRHRLEVVRPGYEIVEQDVEVAARESRTLSLELRRK
jgi:hypothetical protein